MSKILVMTGAYNREKLLPRTIESVLSQTFKEFIYVIVNNGSVDQTQNIIDRYTKLDSRIMPVIWEKNDENINLYDKVLAETYKLPFYFSIDDDDFMENNTLETLYELINSSGADIASVGSKFAYPDGSTKNKYVFNETYTLSRVEAMFELLKREKINSARGGKLYRRELIEKIDFPETSHIRDIHREYRTMNNIKSMIITGKPLFYFYRHDNNVSGLETAEQITPEKMRQHLEANTMRTQWLTKHMSEIKDFVFYCELSFMISLYERIRRLDVKECFGIADEMNKTLLCYKTFLYESGYLKESEKEILNNNI